MRRSGGLTGSLTKRWRSFCSSSAESRLEVWAWGKGTAGQLGGGDDSNYKTPRLIARVEPPRNLHLAHMQGLASASPLSYAFRKLGPPSHDAESTGPPALLGLSCGLFHSALLVDGELWTWGKGEGGRLGLGSEEPKYTPASNPYLEDVRCVALGGLHSMAAKEDGSLYTWGFGAFGSLGHGRYKAEHLPRQLILNQEEAEKVEYVSAGGVHSAAITLLGDLYTWGRDEGDGRLGHGDELETDEGAVSVPLKVLSLPEPVVSVSCGGFFTMALTKDGKTLSWGGNANYELGRGDTHSRCKPSLVTDIESVRIVQVASGGYHAAVLTDDGKVLTWGRGGDGQLGHGSWSNGRTPKVVDALAHVRVVHIACGSFSTAAITEEGALYCWGKNKDCQLGFRGKMDAENIPREVNFGGGDEQPDNSQTVVAVALGACHGISLVLNSRS